MTKGQRPMAVAKIYPEADDKSGRGKICRRHPARESARVASDGEGGKSVATG